MIGIISNRPVVAGPYLEHLARQSRDGVKAPHGDGYGLAILRDGHWFHVIEQCEIWNAPLGTLGTIEGTILLLHSRKATDTTTINLTKLQPLPGPGGSLMFCHNGSIMKHERLASSLYSSAIDSEKYFEIFLRHSRGQNNIEQAFLAAAKEIHAADSEPTSLNAFASDGHLLVAYKGAILPEYAGYHTLYVHERPDMSIISTEMFELGDGGTWTKLEGMYSRSFGD
jgi:predicted glutamine amidotransferase